VTATKSGAHSGTAKTAATDTVAHGVFTTGTPPVISGTPQVGVPLSTTTGSWQPAPTLSYQWLANGQPIAGATASTFTPTADQLAAVLKVRVTAQAVGYRTKRMASVVTGAVAPGQFVMTTGPSISGTPQVDKPLTASPGTWSPTAKISYQWLADGQPITGATKSTYTPNAADLRKQMTLQVTATQLGYAPSTATSAATDPVAPGTFLNTQQPAIEGTPQVGVELRAGHGTWTPAATFQYQWLVGGLPVPNATDRTFTPRPQDVGKQVALQLTASRPGYLTAVVQTPDSAEILPGIITSLKAPEITGVPMVGHTLQASTGEWSVTPENLSYQWYAGSTRIDGATGSSYEPTADVAGQHVHVTVTASAFGYESESASAARTTKVMLGQIAFGRPTVTGHAVIGRTLTAHITDLNPSTATPYYRWYRGDQVIHGARSATYVLQPEDLGHRVHVVVTERASNWVSTTRSSAPVRGIQTRPTVQATATIVNGRVQLDVSVTAPGLTAPYGIAHARVGNRRVGKLDVRQGHGNGLLKSLAKGRHTITVMYDGYGHQTSARTRVTVTVP
jgi:hypothetical protein